MEIAYVATCGAPASVMVDGVEVPYQPRALAKLPLSVMHGVIQSVELAWHRANSLGRAQDLALEEIECCGAPGGVLRVSDLRGDHPVFEWFEPCATCEGDGELFTASGMFACECYACDGDGEGDLLLRFETDADVTTLLRVEEV